MTVNTITGEIVETIGADKARHLTTEAQNEFKSGAAHTARGWELIEQAVMGGGHMDLGYRSPGDYLHAEFEGILAGFNIAERRLAVRTMTGWGLSTRAIAKPLDVDQKTVVNDQRATSGEEHSSPHQTPETAAGGEASADSGQSSDVSEGRGTTEREPVDEAPDVQPEGGATDPETDTSRPAAPRPPVTGIDGKKYAAPAPRATPRKPLTDGFRDAALDLDKLVGRWERLVTDDRFPRNKNEVARYANDLIRARGALERLIEQMTTNTETTND